MNAVITSKPHIVDLNIPLVDLRDASQMGNNIMQQQQSQGNVLIPLQKASKNIKQSYKYSFILYVIKLHIYTRVSSTGTKTKTIGVQSYGTHVCFLTLVSKLVLNVKYQGGRSH